MTDSLRDLGEQKDAAVKSKLPASPGRKSVKKAPAKTGMLGLDILQGRSTQIPAADNG